MRLMMSAAAVLGLTGCVGEGLFAPEDPLAGVERLSDVEISADAEAVSISADDTGGSLLSALLGGNGPASGADDQVPPGTMQAFGEVGRTCGIPRSELGTRVAEASGYQIYDTFPNSTAPRPHYITGFNDRCARQFTAALVLTGDVGTHEVVRYQGSGRNLPYTSTDEAYEQIKSQFCGVSRGQPCGRRLDALARRTTFVTAYERFDSSPVWADILLHEGAFIDVSVERR